MKLDEKRELMMLGMFKDHALEVVKEYDIKTGCGEYRWGKPKSCIHEMYIIFRFNTIITYGDMGAYVMRQDGIDLPWLRGGINDPKYLFEKIRDHKEAYDGEATKETAFEVCYEHLVSMGLTTEEAEQLTRDRVSSVDWMDEADALGFFNGSMELSDAYEHICYPWRVTGFEWIWIGLRTFLKALDSRGDE